jgi:hypothetical protein
LIGALHLLLCFFCSYFIPKDSFDALFAGNNPFTSADYLGFSLINLISAFGLYIIMDAYRKMEKLKCKNNSIPTLKTNQ